MATVPDKPTLDGLEARLRRAVGARRHLSLRSHGDAGRGVRHRHAAAHGERLAPRRPRVQLHPHRHGRPLPAHAGPPGLLPDGLGRQRPADRASRAELLRRPVRSEHRLRPRLRAPRATGQGADPDQPSELRRAVRAAHRRGRAGVRGPVPAPRALGRLDPHLHDRRGPGPPRLAARLPPEPGSWRGVPAGGAHAVGRRLPHRRRPGRARGPRRPGRLPHAGLPRCRRRPPHRHDPPRAAGGLRGDGRPPRRRQVPGAVRHHGDARRSSASRCPCWPTPSPTPRRALAWRWSAPSATPPTSCGGASSSCRHGPSSAGTGASCPRCRPGSPPPRGEPATSGWPAPP